MNKIVEVVPLGWGILKLVRREIPRFHGGGNVFDVTVSDGVMEGTVRGLRGEGLLSYAKVSGRAVEQRVVLPPVNAKRKAQWHAIVTTAMQNAIDVDWNGNHIVKLEPPVGCKPDVGG